MDEGYIKFNCTWIQAPPPSRDVIAEINSWRDKLYQLGLIGAYDNGIGFGNISIRYGTSFLISGSATGNLERLDERHYVVVKDYDLAKNTLTCEGPIKASSESLTHAAVYECSPETCAVIHVHSLEMWQKLLGTVPTTRQDVPYGTPEMAEEIKRLFRETDVAQQKFLVMAGHEEGIIGFGRSLEEAGRVVLGK